MLRWFYFQVRILLCQWRIAGFDRAPSRCWKWSITEHLHGVGNDLSLSAFTVLEMIYHWAPSQCWKWSEGIDSRVGNNISAGGTAKYPEPGEARWVWYPCMCDVCGNSVCECSLTCVGVYALRWWWWRVSTEPDARKTIKNISHTLKSRRTTKNGTKKYRQRR